MVDDAFEIARAQLAKRDAERAEKETRQSVAVAEARALYGSDDIEIDEDAEISETGEGTHDAGTWVQAWVFVPKGETE